MKCRSVFFLLTVLLLVSFSLLNAQQPEEGVGEEATSEKNQIYPPVLYPGMNVIQLDASNGFEWVSLHAERLMENIEAREEGDGVTLYKTAGRRDRKICHIRLREPVVDCPATVILEIELFGNDFVYVPIWSKNCDGPEDTFMLTVVETWNLDVVEFSELSVGEEECREFGIHSNQESSPRRRFDTDPPILYAITSPDTNVQIRLRDSISLPLTVESDFVYDVCYRGTEPGTFRFPVITWLRRDYPFGGHLTYPVADTGLVRVRKSGRGFR